MAEASVPTTVVVTVQASDTVMTEVVGTAEAMATEDASAGSMPATEQETDAAMMPVASCATTAAADARPCDKAAVAGGGDMVDACTAPERDSPGTAAAAAEVAIAAAVVAAGAAASPPVFQRVSTVTQALTLDLSSDEEVTTVHGLLFCVLAARWAAGPWLPPLLTDFQEPHQVRRSRMRVVKWGQV